MAKHCDVCNQDYADDLPVCPHCAAAKKTQLADFNATGPANELPPSQPEINLASSTTADKEEPATPPTEPVRMPADSAIDFGQSPTSKPATGDASGAEPSSISGVSEVAWSALVEEPAAEEVKVDAPSDADLLARAAAEVEAAPSAPHEEMVGELGSAEPPAPAATDAEEAEGIDLSAAPPEAERAVSDSTVDLGGSPAELVEEGSGVEVKERPPESSEVFMAELASDASRVDLVGESGVNLSGIEVVDLTAPSQAESTELAGENAALQEPAAEVVEAVADPHSPEAELTEEAVLDAAVVDEDSSAVDLGASPVVSEEVISAVESEEAVEAVSDSGIDRQGSSVSALSDSGSPLPSESSIDFGSQPEVAVESSSAPVANASDLALASLLEDDPSKEKLVEEKEAVGTESTVSETEVNDLLAGLEQTPAEDELAARMEGETADEVAEGEDAVAAAEEEEAAETSAEEEKKPAKPVKQRSRVPALAGGTVLGLLLGAGGLIGARFGGIDVPAMIGAGEKAKSASQAVAPPPKPSFEAMANLVQSGDWKEAAKAGIEQTPDTDPKQLAARGEYRLGAYLQEVGAKKIDPEDPALQRAIADLTKAAEGNSANAIYDLGLISELAENFPKAREEYAKGVQAFPDQKRRFQSALDRVDLKAAEKARGEARTPMQERERIALLALLLIGLQQPPAQQPPPQPGQPPASAEEAGFDFWDAAKLARQGKFADAVRALDKARKLHQERRFTRLRKAQNPLSDPTEDIFLRCCDELKAYWQMQDHLRDGGYLTEKNTVPQALSNLLQTAQASAMTVKDVSDKLVAAKAIAEGDNISKGIDRTLAAKKAAETEAAELQTELEKTTKAAKEQAAKLENSVKELGDKLADADKEAKKLKADNAGLSATLKKITDELAAAKLVDPKGKVDVGEAVKKAVDVAKLKDPEGVIRKQRGDLVRATAALKERWQPEEMMPLWRLLLEQNRGRTELANKAAQDVARVQTGPEVTAAQKGEAQIVQGLALRNNEKFAEAKAALQAGRSAVDRGEWLMVADAALKEVSDPAAYYSVQARMLSDRGQLDAALTVLAHALTLLPENQHPKLFAQRSLIELDAARSKARGALSPSDPLVTAASKDAAAAAKAGLAEGHYAAGRVAEEMGQWEAAIQNYRKALAAHRALDAEGSRYRVALARVLLQPRAARPGQPAAPAAPPAGNKVGWRDPAPYPARQRQDLKEAVLMVVLGLQAPLLPGEEPGLEEAEKLADDILKAPPGTVPFNIHAQALAIKGLWSEALREYVAGIRPMLPREYGDGLLYLILNDPRLKRPDSLRIPNPMEAEKHFAAGLNFYFDGAYANAEQEFLLTIRNESQDARYFYFLGMTRLARNNRRDAFADFAEGAQLERVNRPAPAAVSEALERIQGPMRCLVNEYRYRPERLEPADPARRR